MRNNWQPWYNAESYGMLSNNAESGRIIHNKVKQFRKRQNNLKKKRLTNVQQNKGMRNTAGKLRMMQNNVK